jgi:hypothetical protein
MRPAVHVEYMGRDLYRVLVGNLSEREQLGDSGVGGRITLRWIFRKNDVKVWTESCWLRIETGGGHL